MYIESRIGWWYDLKDIKESKIRIKKDEKKDEYDTLGITMELEKSLRIDDEVKKEKHRKKERARKKILKNITILLLGLGVAAVCIFFIWLNDTYKTNEYSSHYMLSTGHVEVKTEKNGFVEFIPKANAKNVGVIIYPGQKIEPKSYARLSNIIANSKYNVFVPKLRFNFSPFSSNLATNIIKDNPEINTWYLVAHSSSGDIALNEAANQKKISGVVFLGTYPSGDDLKLINKPVLSIWGTKDGVLDLTRFNEYKNNMPANAHFYEIIGGNNTNFADIETVQGDNKAIISAESQQMQSANEIIAFINNSMKTKN